MATTIPQFRAKGKIANTSPHDQVWLIHSRIIHASLVEILFNI